MNIVLIAADTLRKDHLSCYGYRLRTSPNIDELASRGVLFENAIAQNIPTHPSFTSIYTGVHGLVTGVVGQGPAEYTPGRLSERFLVFPELLQRAGYVTAAVDNLSSQEKPWFGRGYSHYIRPRERRGSGVTESATSWIRDHSDERFFLFVHYWNTHAPYLAPEHLRGLYYGGVKDDPSNRSMEPLKKNHIYHLIFRRYDLVYGAVTDINYIKAQYDSCVTSLDEEVGRIAEAVEETGKETAIILASDHGESLIEHDVYFDHTTLYEPDIRVPLIISGGDALPSGKRIGATVQNLDIAPTILGLAGATVPSSMEGSSLLSLASGERTEGYREVVLTVSCWQTSTGLRTDRWKFIRNVDQGFYEREPRELYDLERDPKEERNLAEDKPDILDAMELRLTRLTEARIGKLPNPVRIQAQRTGAPASGALGEPTRIMETLNLTWKEWVENSQEILSLLRRIKKQNVEESHLGARRKRRETL